MGLDKFGATICKEIIAWARTSGSKSLLATRPIKINTCGLKYAPKLQSDVVQITSSKTLQQEMSQLKSLLGERYANNVDWEKLIPKNITNEEKIKIIRNLKEEAKFFSRIASNEAAYGKNFEWAHKMLAITKETSQEITSGKNFNEILQKIAKKYKNSEWKTDTARYELSGGYRGNKPTLVDEDYCLFMGIAPKNARPFKTGYGLYGKGNAYSEYASRLDNAQIKSPYQGFTTTDISVQEKGAGYLIHPRNESVNSNLKFVEAKYNECQKIIQKSRNGKSLSSSDIKALDENIAETTYLLSHTVPFERGSNGIIDILMRSLYNSAGISKPALKKGVSHDLEAFCLSLNEYKQKWNSFFVSP